MTEQAIQTKIKKRLQREGWTVVKLIKTSINGIPDLLALRNGVAMFVEVKKPGGELSPLQAHVIEQLIGAGFTVKIWKDYETDF